MEDSERPAALPVQAMTHPGWTWINEPLTANDPRIAAELVAEYEYVRYDPGYVGKVQRRPNDENPKPSRIYTDDDGTVHIVND